MTTPLPHTSFSAQPSGPLFHVTLTRSKFDHAHYDTIDVPPQLFVRNLVKRGHTVGEKDGSGLIAARFRPGTNLEDANVVACTAIILDVDGKYRRDGQVVYESVDPAAFLAPLPFLGVVHTSHGHRDEHSKFRVILPLKQPLAPLEALRLWWYLYERTGQKADVAARNPSRMFYLPRCPVERRAEAWIRPLDGPLLSVDVVPPTYVPPGLRQPGMPSIRRAGPGRHAAPPSLTEARLLLRLILRHPLVRWARENPDALRRKPWFGIATNFIAAVHGHPALMEEAREAFHALSRDADCYGWRDCEDTWRSLRGSADMPMLFSTMVEEGVPEEVCIGGVNLISAARMDLHKFR